MGLTVTDMLVGKAHCPASGVNVYVPETMLSIEEGLHVPVILLVDVLSNVGTLAPIHILSDVPILNTGVILGLMVTVKFIGRAHWPASGVKVYTPELLLSTTDGLQLPVTALSDVLGNAGTLPPAHTVSEVPKLNVGVTFGVTVTVKVIGRAHWPAVGVNVYMPEVWLSTTEGLHVPVMLLSDVVGNAGTDPPSQMVSELPNENVGVIFGVTLTVNVVVKAHCPAAGVNV
jgi:hypothetical protein